jgi:FkbM family methyltransferase
LLIDADERMVAEARWHLSRNHLKHLEIVFGAVGLPAEMTSATFHLHASSAASTLLDYDAHTQPPVKGRIKTVTVPAVSIAHEWRLRFGETPVDLVKMNIEGAELDVIRHERDFFRDQVFAAIIQWHKWHVHLEELDAALGEIGFTDRQIFNETQWYGTALYRRARGSV